LEMGWSMQYIMRMIWGYNENHHQIKGKQNNHLL
jgi:hypothetical protein